MDSVERVAEMIMKSKKCVVFTGAGMSTESGIPDFRSPGGTWEKYDPNELTFQKFLASEAGREHYWAFHSAIWPPMLTARPNPGHYAIAELYKMGKIDCCITQNVDGLHQESGIPDSHIIELHGTMKWVSCLDCQKRFPRVEIQKRVDNGEKVPRCELCGGLLKPSTIAFGQPMPLEETREAEIRSGTCDVFISCGSSLVVYPAAGMPVIAKRSGAQLVIINLTETPHDPYADVVINSKTGEVLPVVVDILKAHL